MNWNYRIVRKKSKDSNGFTNDWLEFHEVYYDSQGKIEGFSENPICVGGSNLRELEVDLLYMIEALKKPILNANKE